MSAHSRIMLGSRRAYIVHNGIAHRVCIFTLVSWLQSMSDRAWVRRQRMH